MDSDARDTKEHLIDVLKDFDTAMLVTHSHSVGIHARPMHVAERTADGDIVLATRMDTAKVEEIWADGAAALTFQSERKFAVLNGWATVDRDPAQVERLWTAAWKAWFPQGRSDPDLCLIRFETDNGEYWDNAGGNGIRYVLRAVGAIARKSMPRTDPDQHAKVTL